jgi:hypothetical protein
MRRPPFFCLIVADRGAEPEREGAREDERPRAVLPQLPAGVDALRPIHGVPGE